MKIKMISSILPKITEESGASAVEFAIILPLLVMFVFGIIEFSIMFYDKAVITNASREGARAGIVFADPRPDAAEIQSVVNNYANNMLITFGSPNLQVPPPTPCVDSGDELTVTVTYEYDFLILPNILAAFLSGGSFGGGSTIGATTKMRCE
ncbi:MAG: pilus assembly protein [Desulfobacterales bacterium]